MIYFQNRKNETKKQKKLEKVANKYLFEYFLLKGILCLVEEQIIIDESKIMTKKIYSKTKK